MCVDDPTSASYGRILDRRSVPAIDWRSAEQMHRQDALYAWVVDVAANAAHHADAGSCIFLHVWDGPHSTTVGCTAMAEPALAHLLGTLDAHATPMFVLLPSRDYDALAGPWGLPSRSGPATLPPRQP